MNIVGTIDGIGRDQSPRDSTSVGWGVITGRFNQVAGVFMLCH